MNVLITGGAGFIGVRTANALVRAGRRVRVLDILDPQVHGTGARRPGRLHKNVEFVKGDVRDPRDVRRSLKDVNAVLHFASLTGVGQSMFDVASYVATNVEGTANLIEQILRRQKPFPKLLLSSSRAVYGEGAAKCSRCGRVHPGVRDPRRLQAGMFSLVCPACGDEVRPAPTRESDPLTPVSCYGVSKMQQEELVRYAGVAYGLPAVILRYFNVYGAGQSMGNPYTGIVSIFFNRILHGQPIHLYEGGAPLRDFVHVSDVVRANLLALRAASAKCPIFNIGSGTAVSVKEMARRLGHVAGRLAETRDTGEFRAGDIYSCVADGAAARRILNFRAKVDLEKGLRDFVAWARNEKCADRYDQMAREMANQNVLRRSKARRGAVSL